MNLLESLNDWNNKTFLEFDTTLQLREGLLCAYLQERKVYARVIRKFDWQQRKNCYFISEPDPTRAIDKPKEHIDKWADFYWHLPDVPQVSPALIALHTQVVIRAFGFQETKLKYWFEINT